MDTRPHAPAVGVVLAGRERRLPRRRRGAREADRGPVYVCTAPGANLPVPADPARASSRSSPARIRPDARPAHPPARRRSTTAGRSGTSATRTSPRSGGSSRPASSTSSASISLAGPGVAAPAAAAHAARRVARRAGRRRAAPRRRSASISGSVLDGRAASGEVRRLARPLPPAGRASARGTRARDVRLDRAGRRTSSRCGGSCWARCAAGAARAEHVDQRLRCGRWCRSAPTSA